MVLLGQLPVTEMLAPPTRDGEAVPVPPFASESKPVTPPFPETPKFMVGMSAPAKGRNPGVAAAPVDGPAKTVFALSLASVPAKVPAPVTGVPVTLNIAGKESPTLVTVPRPASVVGVQAVPFHSSIWPELGANEESGCPSRPITVWLVEVPLKSPAAVNEDAGPQEPQAMADPVDVKH